MISPFHYALIKTSIMEMLDLLKEFVVMPKDVNLGTPTMILEKIADYFGATGCVFWHKKQYRDLLYTKALWLGGKDDSPVDDLKMNTITGRVIKTLKYQYIPSVKDNPNLSHQGYLEKYDFNSLVIVPLQFSSENTGAMTIYKKEENGFTDKEIQEIRNLAMLLPGIYSAMRERVYFRLINHINRIFDSNPSLSGLDLNVTIKQICKVISDSFQCEETTIFFNLNNERDELGKIKYIMMGSTWDEDKFPTKDYPGNGEFGLTGYVLEHSESVRIFDLRYFEENKEEIRKVHPKIKSSDSLGMKKIYKDRKIPLSFISVPMVIGEEVIGAIRCSGAKKSPYYFTRRELELLQLIGNRVGQILVYWKHNVESDKRHQTWRNLYNTIKSTNDFVKQEIRNNTTKIKNIYNKILPTIITLIPEIENIDIVSYNEANREFKVEATVGENWSIEKRKLVEYWASVHRAKLEGLKNKETNSFDLSGAFGSMREVIIFPLRSAENKFLGILNIRCKRPGSLPDNTLLLDILVEQLELYTSLLISVAEFDLREQQQRQTFEDLMHQLKSPVSYYSSRFRKFVEKNRNNTLVKDLLPIQGLISKTEQTVSNIALFSSLAANQDVKIRSSYISSSTLRKLLIEVASDNKQLVDKRRNIEFEVVETFEQLSKVYFRADPELLRQAITSLVENAAKYSIKNSIVEIYALPVEIKNEFWVEIKVRNQGLVIKVDEISKAATRNWRSTKAKLTTAEGNGIGLWITKHIMKAHKGDLVIRATTEDKWNEISLMFNAEKI